MFYPINFVLYHPKISVMFLSFPFYGFRFAEASSGDDSIASNADDYEEDKKNLPLGSSSRNHTSGNILIAYILF